MSQRDLFSGGIFVVESIVIKGVGRPAQTGDDADELLFFKGVFIEELRCGIAEGKVKTVGDIGAEFNNGSFQFLISQKED